MPIDPQYAVEQTMRLLQIDSPTGYTACATDYLLTVLSGLGFQPGAHAQGLRGVQSRRRGESPHAGRARGYPRA